MKTMTTSVVITAGGQGAVFHGTVLGPRSCHLMGIISNAFNTAHTSNGKMSPSANATFSNIVSISSLNNSFTNNFGNTLPSGGFSDGFANTSLSRVLSGKEGNNLLLLLNTEQGTELDPKLAVYFHLGSHHSDQDTEVQ